MTSLIVTLVCIAVMVFYHAKTQRIMNKLDKMLDEAARGEFEAKDYDESQLSKIESKMSRFLSESKLKKRQIEHEQQRIRALVSDISHQTKTPIANVLLYAQLLHEQGNLPKDAKALAAQISAGAEKLNFLIQALVKASRLESGLIKVAAQKGDARQLVAAALDECAPKARKKGVALALADTADPVWALFDSKWGVEALYNIVDNAVKYTGAGGRVDVSMTSYEMFVRIDIRDTGRGIRAEDLPRVFGRFWRAREYSDSEGVGIGLYLAREIIAAGGGYIKVNSIENKGSVFSVFLPKG